MMRRCRYCAAALSPSYKSQLPFTGGECCPGCVKPRHPVRRLRRRCWGHVQVLIIPISWLLKNIFAKNCVQAIRRCHPFCWSGRQWASALPHGPQWHLPAVWCEGDWIWKRGSPAESARGLEKNALMSKYFTAFCNTTSNQAYHKSMTLKEATKSAFTILKQVRNEALKSGF